MLAKLRLFLTSQVSGEVQQFQRRDIHFDFKGLLFVAEIVVEPDGGDGDESAECGGDEGFTNPLNDHHGAKPLRSNATFECVKEADDRAEQADERGGGSDGGKATQKGLDQSARRRRGLFAAGEEAKVGLRRRRLTQSWREAQRQWRRCWRSDFSRRERAMFWSTS